MFPGEVLLSRRASRIFPAITGRRRGCFKLRGVCLQGRAQDVQTVGRACRCAGRRDGEEAREGLRRPPGLGRVQASWNRSRDSCSRWKGLTLFRLLSERVQLGRRTERPKGTAREPQAGRGLWPPLPTPSRSWPAPAFPGCQDPKTLRMFNLCSKHCMCWLGRKVHLGFSVAPYGEIRANISFGLVGGPGTRGLHVGSCGRPGASGPRAPRSEPGPSSLLGFPHGLLVFHWAPPRRKAPGTDRARNHRPCSRVGWSRPAGLRRRLSLKWGEACGPGPLAEQPVGAGTP